MLEVVDLACERNQRALFRGVSFTLRAGDLLHLAGANGSGKTSLLKIVCGLLEPTEGEVRWKGERADALREEFREQLVYLGHADGLHGDLSAHENLKTTCLLSRTRASDAEIGAALESLGVGTLEETPAHSLSQGQRRRAAVARLALSREKPLWLLDEPFNALDENAVARVSDLIDAHRSNGGMLLLTTHGPLPKRCPASATLSLG